jgi:hypothetical protein
MRSLIVSRLMSVTPSSSTFFRRALDQLSCAVVLGLLADDEGPPVLVMSMGLVRNGRRDRDGAEFQPADAVHRQVLHGLEGQLRDQRAGARMGHQDPAVHIEGAGGAGGQRKALVLVPFEGLRGEKRPGEIGFQRHRVASIMSHEEQVTHDFRQVLCKINAD